MWMTGRLEAHGNPDLASGGTHCYLSLGARNIKAEPFWALYADPPMGTIIFFSCLCELFSNNKHVVLCTLHCSSKSQWELPADQVRVVVMDGHL